MDEAEYADRIAIIDRGSIVALDTPDALKRVVGADTVELTTADDALAAIRLSDAGYRVSQSAENLIVFAQDGETQVPRLIEVVGVPVSKVHVHRPTLDDVFLHFTGRQIREDHTDRAMAMPMRMRVMARRH